VVGEQDGKNSACSGPGYCMAVVNTGTERNLSLTCLGMTYYYIIVKGYAVLVDTARSKYLPIAKNR